MKRFAILGLSSFGIDLVKTLAKKNVEIIAVDIDEHKVNLVKDIANQAITMDATNRENLISVGIPEYDCVIVCTGPSLEPSILTVHLLKELGVKKIIAKALTEDHEKILLLVGAHEVTFPERDIARKIGSRLTIGNLLDFLPIEAGYVIEEIAPLDSFVGKTLADLELRKKFNITVIGIKSLIPEATILNPAGNFRIKESDILLVFGSEKDITIFHKKIKK